MDSYGWARLRPTTTALLTLGLMFTFSVPAHADWWHHHHGQNGNSGFGNGRGNNGQSNNYFEGFEQGDLFFDDAVGVFHVRPSGSTAETDYAPGISASQGGNDYARLQVQSYLQNGCTDSTDSNCGINGDQTFGACIPGAPGSDNSVSCGGPFTEWGLPFGGVDGDFDSGVAIKGNGALTSVDIYLDTAFASASEASMMDYRFDWDSDLLDNQGQYLQDYVFNVAVGNGMDSCAPGTGGYYAIEASTNSQRSGANAHNLTPPNPPQACISKSGWYTFTHLFTRDQHGNLQVYMYITQAQSSHVVASWTLHPLCMGTQLTDGACPAGATVTTPLPFSAAGANFLGWFPDQEINDLAIDNIVRLGQ